MEGLGFSTQYAVSNHFAVMASYRASVGSSNLTLLGGIHGMYTIRLWSSWLSFLIFPGGKFPQTTFPACSSSETLYRAERGSRDALAVGTMELGVRSGCGYLQHPPPYPFCRLRQPSSTGDSWEFICRRISFIRMLGRNFCFTFSATIKALENML